MHTITTIVFLPSAGCDAQVTGRVSKEDGTCIDSIEWVDDEPWTEVVCARCLTDGDQQTAVDALETKALETESMRPDIEVT